MPGTPDLQPNMPLTERNLDLLYPLDWFYERVGRALPRVREVPGAEVPEPFHKLLVGNHDMTPTLEAFHGERIYIRVLEREIFGDTLIRLVVLNLENRHRPVEIGAIVIHLNHFPAEARALVLEGRIPVGTILADFAIVHESRPQAFISVESDAMIAESLAFEGDHTLFGRRNFLLTSQGEVLADIIEILAPESE